MNWGTLVILSEEPVFSHSLSHKQIHMAPRGTPLIPHRSPERFFLQKHRNGVMGTFGLPALVHSQQLYAVFHFTFCEHFRLFLSGEKTSNKFPVSPLSLLRAGRSDAELFCGCNCNNITA